MTSQLLGALESWTAHGLRFTTRGDAADVFIQAGPLPLYLPDRLHSLPPHDVGVDDFLLRVSPDLRLRATGGRIVTVDAPQYTGKEELTHWLRGPITSALLYQRRVLPLQASAVVMWNRAVAFLSPDDTGRSSLVASLVADGGLFLTDDLLAIRPTAGSLHAYPDSAAEIGARPLAGVFFLEIDQSVGATRLQAGAVLSRLRTLMSMPMLAGRLEAESECFSVMNQIAAQVPAWQLTRPAEGDSLKELVSNVKRCLAGGAASNFRQGVVTNGRH